MREGQRMRGRPRRDRGACAHTLTETRSAETLMDTLTDAMRTVVELLQPARSSRRRRRPGHAAVFASSSDATPTAEPFMGRYEERRTDDDGTPSRRTAAVASQRTAVARSAGRSVTGSASCEWMDGGARWY